VVDHVIKGIGIDIVELARIEKLIMNDKFVKRILTSNEQKKFPELTVRRKVEFLAGRFAAKEAYAKAKGTGIGKEISFQDIEISNDELGKPIVIAKGQDLKPHVSISHAENYAVAQIILESLSS
jgi:holo-[acyl-carrier protein] synthase